MESGSNSGRTSSQATASSRDRNLSNSESTVPDWLKNVSVRFSTLQMEILIAILISGLLLRKRRMYVACVRLDFLWERMECTKRNLIMRVSNFYSSLFTGLSPPSSRYRRPSAVTHTKYVDVAIVNNN